MAKKRTAPLLIDVYELLKERKSGGSPIDYMAVTAKSGGMVEMDVDGQVTIRMDETIAMDLIRELHEAVGATLRRASGKKRGAAKVLRPSSKS